MVTTVDEREGLVRVYWKDVREKVKKVEPQFAQIIDELNPDQKFPLYLAYYPYGAIVADAVNTFFPNQNGGYHQLNDSDVPKEIVKQFGYSADSMPLSIALEKQFEGVIDLKHKEISFPWIIWRPGSITPFLTTLSKESKRIYATNVLLTATAGARSVFMLPSIGSVTNHVNLQRDFNVKSRAPKYLYDHWQIFKEIINNEVIQSDWRACFLYFTHNWVEHLHNDKAWMPLKYYLYAKGWNQFQYHMNRLQYDIIFSVIQKEKNLKPNPYLVDTAKHLLAIMLGTIPGFAPVMSNDSLPYEIIQKSYVESYGLKKYLPTILVPTCYQFETDQYPIYYSLHPSTHVFSPTSREVSSTLFEMRELEHIMKIFLSELSKETSLSGASVITTIAKNIQLQYFHSKSDPHFTIKSATEIAIEDLRFREELHKYKHPKATFASDAPFVRGCIRISTNV